MIEHETRRVLVVDDDPVMRELLELWLTRKGYTADLAESGEEALERLHRADAAMPDVVLADLQMPGMGGQKLAEGVRSMGGGRVRMVAMSGDDAEEEDLYGFHEFLRKPFTLDALSRTLEREEKPTEEQPVVQKEEVLDRKIYDQLAASMGEERLGELYSLCLNDTKRRIKTMREAALREDDVACRRQAHTVKGSCSMVGARQLQRLAESIEDHGLVSDSEARLNELLQACNRLEGMLIEYGSVTENSTTRKRAREGYA